MIKKGKITIFGGTGSFGKFLVKQLIKRDFDGIITIFSRDEKKQIDLQENEFNDKRIKFVIGCVRDYSSVDYVLRKQDYVFHAAALKHVSTCEKFPEEAVKTNVTGSKNIIEASISNKIKNAIFLSTDKAVEPINAMGMTKALMEKSVYAASTENPHTKLNVVRYGNVLCSRGSVIPLFLTQLKRNRITITEPEMTRFLIKLSDCVSLIDKAIEINKQGMLLVKKAPAARVGEIADACIEIAKKNGEAKKKFIGVRLGEKIHESLLNSEELSLSKSYGDFYVNDRGSTYKNLFFEKKGIRNAKKNSINYSSNNTRQLKKKELVRMIKSALKEVETDGLYNE